MWTDCGATTTLMTTCTTVPARRCHEHVQASLEQAVSEAPAQFAVATRPFTFGTEDAVQLLCNDWGIANVPGSLPVSAEAPDKHARAAFDAKGPHRLLDTQPAVAA